MIDKSQIPAAMEYYNLDSAEHIEAHMIEATFADFCNALDYFDTEKKFEDAPDWVFSMLYELLFARAVAACW